MQMNVARIEMLIVWTLHVRIFHFTNTAIKTKMAAIESLESDAWEDLLQEPNDSHYIFNGRTWNAKSEQGLQDCRTLKWQTTAYFEYFNRKWSPGGAKEITASSKSFSLQMYVTLICNNYRNKIVYWCPSSLVLPLFSLCY